MNKLLHKNDSKRKGISYYSFLFAAIIVLFTIHYSYAGNSWVSIKAGNWNDATVWDCNCHPAATDNITIDFPVTLNVSTTCANLTIIPLNSTGVFTMSGSNSLHVTGNLSITTAGTLNVNGTSALTVDGTATGSADANTINISTGAVSFTKALAWTWANKINVNVTGSGSLSFSSATLTLNSASTLAVTGAGGSITFNGALTESGVSSVVTLSAAGTLTFNGGVTHSNGTISNTGNAGTINFNAGYSKSGGSTFTSMAGETINLGGNLTNNTSTLTFNPASTAVFNANTPNITSTAAIILGSIQINSGVIMALQGDISLAGNWTNNGGTFTHNSHNVTFNGASATAQTITTSGGETFYNLIIAATGTGGISLGSNVTATNILTLTSGVITTGANALILSNTTATNLSYTNGFVNGTFRRYIASNTSSYLFPVGKGTLSTNRHQASFVNNSITGVTYLDASVSDFVQASPNNDASLNTTQQLTPIEYTAGEVTGQTVIWTLTPNAAPTGGSYGVQLYVENTNLSASDDNMFCPVKRDEASVTYADFLTYDGTTAIPAAGAAGRIYNSGNGYAQ